MTLRTINAGRTRSGSWPRRTPSRRSSRSSWPSSLGPPPAPDRRCRLPAAPKGATRRRTERRRRALSVSRRGRSGWSESSDLSEDVTVVAPPPLDPCGPVSSRGIGPLLQLVLSSESREEQGAKKCTREERGSGFNSRHHFGQSISRGLCGPFLDARWSTIPVPIIAHVSMAASCQRLLLYHFTYLLRPDRRLSAHVFIAGLRE